MFEPFANVTAPLLPLLLPFSFFFLFFFILASVKGIGPPSHNLVKWSQISITLAGYFFFQAEQ